MISTFEKGIQEKALGCVSRTFEQPEKYMLMLLTSKRWKHFGKLWKESNS